METEPLLKALQSYLESLPARDRQSLMTVLGHLADGESAWLIACGCGCSWARCTPASKDALTLSAAQIIGGMSERFDKMPPFFATKTGIA